MKRLLNWFVLAFAMLGAFPATASAQVYTKLRDLGTQAGDPINPAWAGVFAQGRDGNLYSTTQGGGANAFGTVFQLTPSGTMTRLYSFTNQNDGAFPNSGLTLSTDGNLYGTATVGGLGFGTIFKITTGGTFTALHSFNGSTEGLAPNFPPIQGPDGNYYGTTGNGFNAVFGTVYKMTPAGVVTVIYTFDGVVPHGRYPRSLILGSDGAFYGTARGGGANSFGMVFKITSAGQLTALHSFNGTDGQYPDGAIIQGTDGNFYGTTRAGGTDSLGVVYKMTPAGVVTVLHNFLETDGLGYAPFSSLVQATDGKLYGSTIGPSHGLLYQITTGGVFNVVHAFTGPDGQSSQVTPIQHTSGTFFGDTDAGGTGNMGCITCGVVYSLDMSLGPFVTFLPPQSSGIIGKSIGFLGQGFTGTTAVSFGGTTATFHVVSDTYLTATVPSGGKTGLVTVTTPGGSLTSNRTFRVTPKILSFNPTSGTVGTPVTITGSGFIQTTKVTFGGVRATVFTIDSDTQVTATVPSGARTGKIAITTKGGTAQSATTFTVTP